MDIRTYIEAIARRATPVYIQVGTVKSVDEDKRTIEVEPFDEGSLFVDVPLQAISEGKKGAVLIPKKDSAVIFALLDQNNAICLGFSEVDKILVAIEETEVEITKDGVVVNGGENGGLAKIEEVVKKLNALEKEVNDLKIGFTTWVPVPQDGGAALKGGLASWAGKQMVQTKKTDLEDDKVKH